MHTSFALRLTLTISAKINKTLFIIYSIIAINDQAASTLLMIAIVSSTWTKVFPQRNVAWPKS